VRDSLGQEPPADRFELERRPYGCTGDGDGAGGQLEQYLSGERVVSRMQQLKPRSQVAQIIVPDETAQSDDDRLEAVIVRRAVSRRCGDHAARPSPSRLLVLAIASGDVSKERHLSDASAAGLPRVP
jgi:hypothetical protein